MSRRVMLAASAGIKLSPITQVLLRDGRLTHGAFEEAISTEMSTSGNWGQKSDSDTVVSYHIYLMSFIKCLTLKMIDRKEYV